MKLYRGLSTKDGIKSLRNPVGIHWTNEITSAVLFAGAYGLVLAAEVSPEDIVRPGTPEWSIYQRKYLIFDPDSSEKEITVRKGSTVIVSSVVVLSGWTDAFNFVDDFKSDRLTSLNYKSIFMNAKYTA